MTIINYLGNLYDRRSCLLEDGYLVQDVVQLPAGQTVQVLHGSVHPQHSPGHVGSDGGGDPGDDGLLQLGFDFGVACLQ